MDRRRFCGVAGTGAAGAIVLPVVDGGETGSTQERRRYAFTIEIVEGIEGGCGPGHEPGDVFQYPAQKGQICAWLMESMDPFLRVLEYGGTLPWMYQGTPYEKVIDPDGVTTEFVRCPDPSRTVVAKITRTRVA